MIITVWLVRAVKSDYFMLAMAVIKTDRSELVKNQNLFTQISVQR